MIVRIYIVSLLFAICLLVSGCYRSAPVVLIDKLPENASKGYVAFKASYSNGECGGGWDFNIDVIEVINGKKNNLGLVTTRSQVVIGLAGILRAAASPGPHRYAVLMRDFRREIVVSIEKDRVTPVNIEIQCASTPTEQSILGRRITTYQFDVQFRTEDSVSLEVWKEREKFWEAR